MSTRWPHPMPSLLPLAVLGLVACGSADKAGGDSTAGAKEGGTALTVSGLVLEVVPTDVAMSLDAVVLPQSVPVDAVLEVGSRDRDLGTVRLVSPVTVGGTVVGLPSPVVVPVASLPGQEQPSPVTGEIRLLHDSSVQSYRAPLVEGVFGLDIIPEPDYRVALVPDDPLLPLSFADLSADADTPSLRFDIGSGVPIYGFVTTDGQPVAGATVVAEQEGVPSAAATTDARGFYELRVSEGDATVRCRGRDPSIDPELVITDAPIPASGLRRDFTYPASARVLVEGRLQDLDGRPLDAAVEVRFTATSLDGLETQEAQFETTDVTGDQLLTRVPPGVYDIEVLPPADGAGATYSPIRLEDVVLEAETDLGTLVLEPTRSIEGTVADPSQQLVPRVAVACREDGFGRRSYTTVSDTDGRFSLDLPQVPVTCAFTPPVELTSVALTRRSFDARDNANPSFTLASGQTVGGRVTRDGEGEQLVVVELRDRDERLLGSALTDEDGNWTMQVDLSTVTPD